MKNFEFNELGKIGKSILVQEMKGNDTVYFRLTKLYKDDNGEWHPTKQGVSIPKNEAKTLLSFLEKFIESNPEDGTNSNLTSDVQDL